MPKLKRNKRAEAENRQQSAIARNAQTQINILDTRLGVGVGAVKERAGLQRKIKAT